MYGGEAHLFHVLDSHYNVPRWVIGPSPGNENGWAFCESDARYPQEISGEWISWDGVSWHPTATLRFLVPDHSSQLRHHALLGQRRRITSKDSTFLVPWPHTCLHTFALLLLPTIPGFWLCG